MREKTFVPTFEPLERRDLMTGNLPTLSVTGDVSQYTEQVQAAVSGLLLEEKHAAWQQGDEYLDSFMHTLPVAVANTLTSLRQEETTLLLRETTATVLSTTLPTITWTPALRDAWNAAITPSVQTTAQALAAVQTAIQANAGNPSLTQGLSALRTLLSSSTAPDGTKVTWQALQAEWNTAQAAVENITQIASFNTIARRSVTGSLQVQFSNLPANLAVRFGNVTVALAAGSGTTTIPLQSFTHGDRRVYIVQIVQGGTGTVVIDGLGGFGVQSGKHTYAGYSYDPQANIPSLPIPTVGRSEANTMKMEIIQRALPLLQTTHMAQTGQTLSLPAVPAATALESARTALEANRHSQALMEALPSVAEQECEEFAETMAEDNVRIAWDVLTETEQEYRATAQRLARAQTDLQRYTELRTSLEPQLIAMETEHQALLLAVQNATSQSTQNDARNAETLFMQRTGFPLLSQRDALDTKIAQAQEIITSGETALGTHRSALTTQSSSLTALGEPLSPVLELLPRAWITSLQRNNVQVHLTGKGPMTAFIDGPFYGSVLGALTVEDIPLAGTGGIVSIRPESPAGTYTLHVRDASGTEVWSVELSWNGQQFTAAEADMFSEASFTNHVNLSRLPIGGNGSVEALLAEDLVSDEEASLLATVGTTVASQGRLLTNAQPGYSDVRNAFEWSMFDASRMAVTPEQIQGWWYAREPFMDPQNFAQWKASEALRLNITPAAYPQTYLQELGALEQRLHADWQDRWDRVNQDAGYYNTFLRTIAIPETLTAIASIQAGGNEDTVMTAWRTRMNMPYSAFQSYLTDTGWVRPSADNIWQNVLGMVRSGKAVDISANFNAQDAAYSEWNDNRMNKNAAIAELKEQLDRNEISLDDLSPGDRARIVQEKRLDLVGRNQIILAEKTAMKISQARSAPESSPEKQAAYARAAKKAEVALSTSTHPQIVALREQNPQLFVSMLNNLKSELLNIEIVSMHTIAMSGESDGLAAGSVVIQEQTKDAVLGEIYSREMLAAGVEVNTRTAAGRYFAEIVQQFWDAPTPQARTNIAEQVEAKTGISKWKVLERVEYNGNVFSHEGIAQNLRDLFAEAQYASAFSETMSKSVDPYLDKYVGKDDLADVLTTYRTFDRTINNHPYVADETVRLRFNVNVPAFHHARYYLLDESGAKIGDELPMKNGGVESGAGVLFAEFDAKEIGRRLFPHASAGGPEYRTTGFSIRVVVWTSKEHADRVFEETPVAKMEIENEDRTIEGILKKNFPLGNASQYYWLLGSGFHDGTEFHAADLNSLSGSDTDRGNVVRAVADGTLHIAGTGSYTGNEAADLKWGVVVIDHGDGLQSGYMHMPIFKGRLAAHPVTGVMTQYYEVRRQVAVYETVNGQTKLTNWHETGEKIELHNGMNVGTAEDIGYVGGRFSGSEVQGYNEDLGNAHLHFFMKKNGVSQDLRQGLELAGLSTVKAFDGGVDGDADTSEDNKTVNVRYDLNLQAWVNDASKLALNRSLQVSSDSGGNNAQYFVAWEDGKEIGEMKKVVFDKATGKWLEVDSFGDYTSNEGLYHVWKFNALSNNFEFVWE